MPRPPATTLQLALAAMCTGHFLLRDPAGLAVARLLVDASGLAAGAGPRAVDEAVGAVDFGLDLAMLAAAALLWTRLRRPAALYIAAHALLLAIVAAASGAPHAATAPGSQAARWLGAVALFACWRSPADRGLPARAETLLRIAAAATFAFHGLKALGIDLQALRAVGPPDEFVVLVRGAAAAVGAEPPDPARSLDLLRAIGLVDLAVAVAVLARRWPAVAAWMALWGLATAASRIAAHGLARGLPEFLVRAPHAGVPLALALPWFARGRAASPGPSTRPPAAGG